MVKSKKFKHVHKFWPLILVVSILLIVTLRSFVNKSHSIPISAMLPSPSPVVSLGIDDGNRPLAEIVGDKNLQWVYADLDKKCLLASYLRENSRDDFLEGWWEKPNGIYHFEPINPGEGPIWFIREVFLVRWNTTKKWDASTLCRVGIEMNLQENNDKPKHVWYILDFQDGYVQGTNISSTKPLNWDEMIDGLQLK